jgi:hypothetical protein
VEEGSDSDDDDDDDDDDEVLELCWEVEGGAGAGSGAGAGAGAGAGPEAGDENVLFEVGKITRFAVSPAGTVTTQNWAPPAPTLPPLHALTPIVDGLHSHGIPLQLPLGHSILTANPGSTIGKVFAWQQ